MTDQQFLLDPEDPENPENPVEPTDPIDPEEPGGGEEENPQDEFTGQIKDVSGMFNERGFYKSNEFSFSEDEIINDFNGNLIYNIPLYRYKQGGDLSIDIKLNYNGSVGHSIRTGSSEDIASYNKDRYNLNIPEWILSLNGMAVQVFNFETNYFNPYQNQGTISGDNINMLIPGYHYTNDNRVLHQINNNRDKISLLAGDGSVITLENQQVFNGNTLDGSNYIGNYCQMGKESYVKAKIEFISNDSTGVNAYYRKRRIILLRGDGLEFIYEEDKNNFYDFKDTGTDYLSGKMRFKPLIPLLKEIRDRFGYSIHLEYAYWEPHGFNELLRGRPLLERIRAQGFSSKDFESVLFSFTYAVGGVMITHNNEINGTYFLKFLDEWVSYRPEGDSTRNQLGYLKEIVNPLGQKIEIAYENYRRKYTKVDIPGHGDNNVIHFNNLRRIKSFKNYLHLKREYKYLKETVEMTIQLPAAENYHIISNDFKGYGRDPFFNNMLTEKKEYALENGIQEKNKHSFNYEYEFFQSNGRIREIKPIHANDKLKTGRTIISSDPTTVNNSCSKITKLLEYKIYPLYDPNNSFAYNPDVDGATKLIKETISDYLNDIEVNRIINEFGYDTGAGNPSTGGYSGSFLMKEKKETINNVQKIRTWNYHYKNDNVDNFITQSDETGPDGMVTIRKFKDYYETFQHNQFSNAYNYDLPLITSIYYIYNILSEEYKYRPGLPNAHLNKKILTYIDTTSNDCGYIGQLIKEEILENGTSAKIITKYCYCKNDDTGKALYQACGMYPYKEGNLKEIIRPNGEVTKYFYHPTEAEEVWIESDPDIDAPRDIPHLKFFILYKDGQKVEKWEKIWDHRFPIRTDRIKRAGSNDILISRTYNEYAYDGSPIKSMDENKMLTEFKYGRIHRISKITLPGDFSTEPDGIETYVVSTFEVEDILIKSTDWGSFDGNSSTRDKLSFSNVPRRFWGQYVSNNCMEFKTYLKSSEGIQRYAYINFDKNHFLDIGTITRAELILRPISYVQQYNGNDIGNRRIALGMVYSLYRLWNKCGEGLQGPGGEFFYHHDNASIQRAVFDLNIANDNNCNYSNEISLDIKNFLNSFFQKYGNTVNVGIAIYPEFPELPDIGGINEEELDNYPGFYTVLKLICIGTSDQTWTEVSPRILMDAAYSIKNTKPVFKSGTINYIYNDVNTDNNFIVNIYSIRNPINDTKGRIRHYLDSYGNVKRKDVFTGGVLDESNFNSFHSRVNYLNLPAISKDAAGNMTRLSYDGLQRLIKTENADGSFNTTSYTYQNSLDDYFDGDYTGFIEKQTFTDENGNSFWKYFDAFGNLRREVKFVLALREDDEPENPGEPAEPIEPGVEDVPPIHLITDYKYDDLYRLIEVKTPNDKHIYYQYDGYGRQIQRTTPDTGIVKFKYDSNNNLIFSQDANQRASGGVPEEVFTFRRYDAINRLTILGENSMPLRDFDQIDPNTQDNFVDTGDLLDPYHDFLVVNVYDDLSTAAAGIFTPPGDYQPTQQNSYYYTKGRLAATAYRTRKTDNWSFKYYRYDERGRVVRMWHVINGLGTKKVDYYYNSQDQVTNLSVLPGEAEMKSYRYRYDIPGRLSHLDLETTVPAPQNPVQYFNLARYLYNANSLISSLRLNAEQVVNTYDYNQRNWIMNCYDQLGIFMYVMDYFPNGNVLSLLLQGNYKNNFPGINNNNISFQFDYDKSNRLLNALSNYDGSGHDLRNTYDKDGNILTLKRYNRNGSVTDNFSYTYYSGTNKLKNTGVEFEDYLYDNNGNVIKDSMNKNVEIKYDHRNLITFIKHHFTGHHGEIYTQAIYYYYDEAGNRIRKVILQAYAANPVLPDNLDNLGEYSEYDEELFNQLAEDYYSSSSGGTGTIGDPGVGDNPLITWYVVSNEFYLRGVEDNELVLFSVTGSASTTEKFNFYSSGNEGYIDAQNNRFYYLKDHLGSIKAIINSNNAVISAQDYDMWGYLMEGRSFDPNATKYKFTGKERDKESNYDYFGARYYDSRIGRWGGVEPKMEKYYDISPYTYSKNNSIILIDSDGKDPYRKNLGSKNQVLNILKENEGKSYLELSDTFKSNEIRFIYTEGGGFLDLRHFFAAAEVSSSLGEDAAIIAGELVEKAQEIKGDKSANNPADRPSNLQGAKFGAKFIDASKVVSNFENFINELNPLEPSDPKIAPDRVYIPYDESQKAVPSRVSYKPYHGESPNFNKVNIIP